MFSRIIGTGSYLPEKIVTNDDLAKIMDTSDAWIRDRTGIERRHIAAAGQTTVDMAEHAARRAIEAAGLQPQDIDLICFGTVTPDLVFPNPGVMLQGRLGCTGGPAFSLEAACSSFLYALSVADKFVRSGESRRALVVGAETLSRITDYSDRSTAVLFADGAGAVVLAPSQTPGLLATRLHADGSHHALLHCTGGISAGYPEGANGRAVIRMAGREVFKIAVTLLGRVVEEILAENGLNKSELNWLVPHQANIRIIQALAKKLDLPMERVIVTVQDQGNTSAASVPLALDKGIRDGRIKPGDLILLEAIGGGFTWGAALLRM